MAFRLVQRATYRIIGDGPTSRHLALCLLGNIEMLFSQSSNKGTIHTFPALLVRSTRYARRGGGGFARYPLLGEILRPYAADAVFFLLVIAFLRVDLVALLEHLRRPGLALAATIWTSVAIPLLLGGGGFRRGISGHIRWKCYEIRIRSDDGGPCTRSVVRLGCDLSAHRVCLELCTGASDCTLLCLSLSG